MDDFSQTVRMTILCKKNSMKDLSIFLCFCMQKKKIKGKCNLSQFFILSSSTSSSGRKKNCLLFTEERKMNRTRQSKKKKLTVIGMS